MSKSKTAAVRNSKVNHSDRKSSLLLVPPLIPNGPTTNPCDWNYKDRLSDVSASWSFNLHVCQQNMCFYTCTVYIRYISG